MDEHEDEEEEQDEKAGEEEKELCEDTLAKDESEPCIKTKDDEQAPFAASTDAVLPLATTDAIQEPKSDVDGAPS